MDFLETFLQPLVGIASKVYHIINDIKSYENVCAKFAAVELTFVVFTGEDLRNSVPILSLQFLFQYKINSDKSWRIENQIFFDGPLDKAGVEAQSVRLPNGELNPVSALTRKLGLVHSLKRWLVRPSASISLIDRYLALSGRSPRIISCIV